jgi:hypothetical protein
MMEMLVRDKHSSLFGFFIGFEKKFYKLALGANLMKLFFFVTDDTAAKQYRLFVPDKPLQHSLIFAGKARSLL